MITLRIVVPALLIAIISFVSGAEAQLTVEALKETTKLASLKGWIDQGKFIKANEYKIFLVDKGKADQKGHGVFIVHGFPGSSWDWSGRWLRLNEQLGHGGRDRTGLTRRKARAVDRFTSFLTPEIGYRDD